MSTPAVVTLPITPGDTAWVLTSTALVMLMIPGLGYFYSGLARHKNALSLIFLAMLSLAVVSVQWFIFGFSLAFSEAGGYFIGNFKYAFFSNVFVDPVATYSGVPAVPIAAFMIFQGMFAVCLNSIYLPR